MKIISIGTDNINNHETQEHEQEQEYIVDFSTTAWGSVAVRASSHEEAEELAWEEQQHMEYEIDYENIDITNCERID